MNQLPESNSDSNQSKIVEYNLAFVFILLLVEICLISFYVTASDFESQYFTSVLYSNADKLLQFAVTFIATFSILISKQFNTLKSFIDHELSTNRKLLKLFAQIFIFSAFFATTIFVFENDIGNQAGSLSIFAAWLISAAAVLLSALWIIAPMRNWLTIGEKFAKIFLIAAVTGTVILVISLNLRLLWEPLSYFAINASYLQLQLFYDSVFIDLGLKYLGTESFVVEIAPQCSGLEGMGLAAGITGAYLYASREQMSFPKAFLLVPIAVLLAVILNTVRITALIAIGDLISPDIALGGFHSVAGWLTSIFNAFIVIFVFSSMSAFVKEGANSGAPTSEVFTAEDSSVSTKILIPFILLMLLTLVFGIFTTDFDYWYPIKILVPLFFVLKYLPNYRIGFTWPNFEPFLIGLIGAVLWVALSKNTEQDNVAFLSHIGELSNVEASLWFLGRIIGFLFLAPVLEELVFRCYLLSRISRNPLRLEGSQEFGAISFVVSSALFGLLHADWMAGIVCGMLFAICRYRSKSIFEPIVAHFFTNFILLVYAFVTLNYALI